MIVRLWASSCLAQRDSVRAAGLCPEGLTMATQASHAIGPKRSTWTHIALCVKDIDASIAWYERHTHLRLLSRGEDKDGKNAWLGDQTQADSPFILVLGQFFAGHD